MIKKKYLAIFFCAILFFNCSKKSGDSDPLPPSPLPAAFNIKTWNVDDKAGLTNNINTSVQPNIKLSFTAPLKTSVADAAISFKTATGTTVPFTSSFQNNDSSILITPSTALSFISRYSITISTSLTSKSEGKLQSPVNLSIFTKIDSTDKFSRISDDALLTLVQKQTFKYFWDFAHPVSGLARERNTSGELVTSGGSGFGIMTIPVGVSRQFITRAEGLARMQKIVSFLKNTAQRFHGAYPHWLNGTTGAVIPFSQKDNGADLVETSYLIAGLLTARQYFDGTDAAETALRNDINTIWNQVEWNWFRQTNQDVLYWHWSPNYNWEMNHKIQGWNECLITYVLAAASSTSSITKPVYDNGWASNGGMKNGNNYFSVNLPLGPASGGPLFFAHYSFLGINPNNLTDAYADYFTQNKNHTLINYNYCNANPKNYFGYSNAVWGLTASDIRNGYNASSPTNDVGVIAPTAALSSFPYTPGESMRALKFYYYILGDKLWKEYGFVDAFSLQDPWFADSFLAIDQGPIILMIENYRSGLLWNLFMSCPEVKTGMINLGFQSPYL
ncbi:MAG TPA: glucoamylase family protein [Chitinophagaceae bacterium]